MDDIELTLEDELSLQAYLDGELTLVERQLFEARLEQEPLLAAVLSEWRDLFTKLETLPEASLARSLAAGVLTQLALQSEVAGRSLGRLLAVQLTTALLMALLVWPLGQQLGLSNGAFTLTLQQVWLALSQELTAWWSPDLWVWDWPAAWQLLDQAVPLSLSILLPLAVVAAVTWLASVRFVWRSAA